MKKGKSMTKKQIREKLSIYLDKNDFNIPTLEDMVNFAQEIAKAATKELKEEIKNRKIFLLQRVDSYDNFIDKQFYTTDEELAKKWDDYYRCNYYYGQAIELEEFSDKERVKEELESD